MEISGRFEDNVKQEIEELLKILDELIKNKEAAVDDMDFTLARKYRDQADLVQSKLKSLGVSNPCSLLT